MVEYTNKVTLQGFFFEHGEFVRDMAHTNGIESFWALLKRGYHGIYHKMSPKHMGLYIQEFSRRYNIRSNDTCDQMRIFVRDMAGKRLKCKDLVADNGLPNLTRET